VFVLSLLGAASTLALDAWAMNGTYQDNLTGTRCDPDGGDVSLFAIAAGIALVLWFVLQMATIALLFLVSLSVPRTRRHVPDENAHEPPRPHSLAHWRGVTPVIPGGIVLRDQTTAPPRSSP